MKALIIAMLLLPGLAFSENDHQSLCVDCATIPSPVVGHSEVRLKPTWQEPKPAGDGVGAVRTVCTPSHYNYDDPLVHPYQPGAAHLHMWFGNTAGNAFLTADNIRDVGNSTCRGGIANRSAYWVPAIIDSTDGAVIKADRMHVYYKTGYRGVKNSHVQPPPPGIRLVTPPGKTAYDIRCNGARGRAFYDCGASRAMQILIRFPQCWDGVSLYTTTQSHIAEANNGCPSSHPVALPEITYTLDITIPAGRNAANFRLSSDKPRQRGGESMHADWMNGWQLGLPEVWTREIINEGKSGGSHHAGAGLEWY